MFRSIVLAVVILALTGCHGRDQGSPSPAAPAVTNSAAEREKEFAKLTFAYGKDPACGMPLKAGIGDTAAYKGKLYGFCSKECKAAFLKDPASYLANAK